MQDDIHFPSDLEGDETWAEVYDELRRLAGVYLRDNRDAATLEPTALVNEAYVKVGRDRGIEDREHFLAYAATAMRHVLVDHARRNQSEKRGGDRGQVTLNHLLSGGSGNEFDILAVEEALQNLAKSSARQARVVELRVFGGLTVAESARALGVGERTVKDDWQIARAWQKREMTRKDE